MDVVCDRGTMNNVEFNSQEENMAKNETLRKKKHLKNIS